MCARGIKINENCNLDGRKIVHNRSLGSPGSSSCGRLPTTQWWVSVSLGSYVSWMVGALFIISVSARSYLPLASVKHTRPNLKAKCDWVVGALFRYNHLCAQGVSKSMKIRVWRDQKSSKIEVWGVFGWLGASLAKFGSGFLRKFSPGYAQDGFSEH